MVDVYKRQDVDSLVALARSLDAPINIDTYMYPARRERSAAFCAVSYTHLFQVTL